MLFQVSTASSIHVLFKGNLKPFATGFRAARIPGQYLPQREGEEYPDFGCVWKDVKLTADVKQLEAIIKEVLMSSPTITRLIDPEALKKCEGINPLSFELAELPTIQVEF